MVRNLSFYFSPSIRHTKIHTHKEAHKCFYGEPCSLDESPWGRMGGGVLLLPHLSLVNWRGCSWTGGGSTKPVRGGTEKGGLVGAGWKGRRNGGKSAGGAVQLDAWKQDTMGLNRQHGKQAENVADMLGKNKTLVYSSATQVVFIMRLYLVPFLQA